MTVKAAVYTVLRQAAAKHVRQGSDEVDGIASSTMMQHPRDSKANRSLARLFKCPVRVVTLKDRLQVP
jgi:hypothetical protein